MLHRKWAAIGTLAAALEQKVWIQTTGTLFPNMYIWMIGGAGVGKSRAIDLGGRFLRNIDKFRIAPTSVTTASLVDFLVESKTIITFPDAVQVEYNSVTILADELNCFMGKYDTDMIALLTKLWDVDVPYGHKRRGNDISILIKRPQCTCMVGTTPSNLLEYVPKQAWDQGFTSRLVLIYSNDRVKVKNIFEQTIEELPDDMVHDLHCIRSLYGQFTVEDEVSAKFHEWRDAEGGPKHPRLTHYRTRRWSHILKLLMVSSVDRGPSLIITMADWNRCVKWLTEAESMMGSIFQDGSSSADFKGQAELLYFIANADKGRGVTEDRVIREGRRLFEEYKVRKTIDLLVASGDIRQIGYDPKNQMRTFVIGVPTPGPSSPS